VVSARVSKPLQFVATLPGSAPASRSRGPTRSAVRGRGPSIPTAGARLPIKTGLRGRRRPRRRCAKTCRGNADTRVTARAFPGLPIGRVAHVPILEVTCKWPQNLASARMTSSGVKVSSDVPVWYPPSDLRYCHHAEIPANQVSRRADSNRGPLHYEGRTTEGRASTRGHARERSRWKPRRSSAHPVDASARSCPS